MHISRNCIPIDNRKKPSLSSENCVLRIEFNASTYYSAAKGSVSDPSLRLEMVYPDSINGKHIITDFDTLELIDKYQCTQYFNPIPEPQYVVFRIQSR